MSASPGPRVRTRGGFSVSDQNYLDAVWTSCSNTSYTRWATLDPVRSGEFTIMRDTVIKDFHARSKKGEVFFNPLSFEHYVFGGSGTGYHLTSKTNGCNSPAHKAEYQSSGGWFWNFLPKRYINDSLLPVLHSIVSADSVRDLKSEVSTRVLSERGRGGSNLFESLAEAHQTVSLFEKPLSRLRRQVQLAAKAKREGRFPGYAIDGVSNLWLAYRYGITPLLNDIQAIVDALQAKTERRRESTRAKGLIKSSKVLSFTSDFDILRLNYTVSVDESIVCRAVSLDEFSTSLWENMGFTQKNLITVPWELLKFSFVYDWFINIGDFIGAVVPAFGYSNLGSALTTIHGLGNRYQSTSCVNTNSNYTLDVPVSFTYDAGVLGRTRSGLSYPDIVIKSDFRFDRFKRVADAFALTAQQMSSVFDDRRLGRRIL